MLEGSVLGLASKVLPTFFEESVKTSIDLLNTEIENSNVEEKRVNIEADNKKSRSIRNQQEKTFPNKSPNQRDVVDEEPNENVQQVKEKQEENNRQKIAQLEKQNKDIRERIKTKEIQYELEREEIQTISKYRKRNSNIIKKEYYKMEEEEEHLIEEQQRKKARFDIDEDDNIRGPEYQEERNEKEVDENAPCAVCKYISPEENNEMICCEGCDLYVHQAFYGLENIPEGKWVCKTCEAGVKPKCALCAQSGGAMKITSDGRQWAHVICAWWIPGVKFGNLKEMAPIVDIDKIPKERWSLTCSICKEKVGACIQCEVNNCSQSFHVTCAYSGGFIMDASCSEDNPDPIFKANCKTHGKLSKTPEKKYKGPFNASKRQKSGSRKISTKQEATKEVDTHDTTGTTE
ncbi:NuA3 HAT complex component NTO1,PHD finger protein rhinoceros,Bromodomain and PHD finger-containing protein 3,Bromodomain-containing protein 1,Peregrin,Histone-lysine N-methyltransferase ATX1,E3 ubiquitin-protein ligase Jade-2,Protein Jade-3,Protein Jade-1 [Mytilus edulis]|uniref:PHD-type domain-containing protein n=1 Tax=Mytilus edulis TaxID=6550 RepID=A0A8S3RW95_MYTED|nr:NuA3 HAT complex component NTO1,PHD finger protein rhinoceros,Bromodomain and PHD finger-containing protein 3,Bromodomain-containing protein 1,Peregrin,Histone-lysine N-methyltransferase ATX1,E3 ubiquitin-protein ligase Jade-2,Protein Jade-3,Protein Jade-1 [Mytilus edulis]